MKKLFIFSLLLCLASTSFAGQWCEWDGLAGINCQSDSRGYILIDGFKVSTPAIANTKGFYRLVVTPASLGPDQVVGAEIWGFTANEITKTWAVRDMTAQEIDERNARAMNLDVYWLWKALLLKNVITAQEAAATLPQEMIDAYQARDRLETP